MTNTASKRVTKFWFFLFFLFIINFCLSARSAETSHFNCKNIFDPHFQFKSFLEKPPFITHRNLSDYYKRLGPEFYLKLRSLSENQTWVDFGAGQARAMLDFSEEAKIIPKMEANGFKIPLNTPDYYLELAKQLIQLGKFNYKEMFMEEARDEDIPYYDLGTSYYGPDSYTRDFSKIFNLMLRRMQNLKSELFLVMPATNDKRIQEHYNASWVITNGRKVPLHIWLQAQPGLAIASKEFDDVNGELVLRIKKIVDNYQIKNLELIPDELRNINSLPTRFYLEN